MQPKQKGERWHKHQPGEKYGRVWSCTPGKEEEPGLRRNHRGPGGTSGCPCAPRQEPGVDEAHGES